MLDKEKTLIEIGKRIRQIRMDKEITIQELSDKLDMDFTNVVRIEKGRTNFTIGTLVKVANALEISLKDLF